VIFIETHVFTKLLRDLMSDDEYTEFQQYLTNHPSAGDVIQNTGGLRKIRWSARGKGKRGGVRVIYYYIAPDAQIRLLLIYQKGTQDNLTEEQKKLLRQLNERWL